MSVSKHYTTEIIRCGNYRGWVLVNAGQGKLVWGWGLSQLSRRGTQLLLLCAEQVPPPCHGKSLMPTKILTALHWNILMYSLFNPFVTEYFMTLHCHVGGICKAPFSMSVQDNLMTNIILYQKAFALCLLGSGSTKPLAQGGRWTPRPFSRQRQSH